MEQVNGIMGWLITAIIAAGGIAFMAGKQVQAIANQRLATKALHERLDDIEKLGEKNETALLNLREVILNETDWLVPSGTQAGRDGRGVRNPLRDED